MDPWLPPVSTENRSLTPIFDVAIVGGGLAGASLAVALAPSGRRIALIEAAPFPAVEPAWDERTIAINAASQRIFAGLGVWEAMRPDAAPILATHISERGRFGVARFSAEEAGVEALGWNLPVRAIHEALLDRLRTASSVQLIQPAAVEAVETHVDTIILRLGSSRTVTARLVVATDGAHSAVRRLLGIGAEERDYGQTAIVGAVRPERPHRGIAYERFTPDGPIALLPKPADRCALVWTVPTEKAEEILGWPDEIFLERLQEAFGHRLGRLLETGRRQGYPLTRVMSEKIAAPRVIFAGNAAQTLHPVAAQGFNLGLRDAATVADLLEEADDPGAPEVLEMYERRRRADRDRVSGFTDRLVRIFSNDLPGLRAARHLGLLALDLIPPVKAAVARQNLGESGAMPALARGVRR
jgi:2-octaprenyl-6-methoxyphenol hydroxylase